MGPLEIICGLLLIAYLSYNFLFSSYDFWKIRGVKGPKPIPLFGNFKDVMLLRKSIGEVIKETYLAFPNEPLVGIYSRNTPVLLVKDQAFVKDVLIKDFSNFMHRGMAIHDKVEPLSQHLFSYKPKRWRPLRIKMSPVFTSGKLKDMFYIIQECSDHLVNYLGTLVDRGQPIEVRELTAKFTTDVIGSCVFGLKMNAIADEDSEFRKMGRRIFATNWFRVLKFRIRDAAPKLYDKLGLIFTDRTQSDFFINTIKQTIEYREKENIVRHDFVDILKDLKNNPDKLGDGDIEMTDSLLASQAFVFFIAGFETSSSTISHMLYELAQHHDVQNKLRAEIFDELKANNDELTYESIKNMKYMHQVFQETLRKYPVIPMLMRQTAEEYTFTGTKVTIPANQKVWIPIIGLQHDPNIYPNPDMFNPERFSEESKKNMLPMCYLPFGDGPRNCIGERFAVYQVKTGLTKILQNFKVDVCELTNIPYKENPAGFVLQPIGGITLKLTRLNK